MGEYSIIHVLVHQLRPKFFYRSKFCPSAQIFVRQKSRPKFGPNWAQKKTLSGGGELLKEDEDFKGANVPFLWEL